MSAKYVEAVRCKERYKCHIKVFRRTTRSVDGLGGVAARDQGTNNTDLEGNSLR